MLTVVMLLPSVVFADFNASQWAEEEVKRAVEAGIVPSELLEADLTVPVTRAEFAGIATELFATLYDGQIYSYGGDFADIEGNEYEDYIRIAYYFGITNGTEARADGSVVYEPELLITRQQLAVMLARIIKRLTFESWTLFEDKSFPLDTEGVAPFEDDELIADYAKEAVYYMSKSGIVKGVDQGHFAPVGFATREQAVLIALRIYEQMYKEPEKPVVKTADAEAYIGKGFDEVMAEFGKPQYAFSFDGWYYTYYCFGDYVFASDANRFFVPVDGSPVYPEDELYQLPAGKVKGVLVSVNQWLGENAQGYTVKEVNEKSGLNFIPLVEYSDNRYYTTAYDSVNVVQYLIKNKGDVIQGDDLIFIQDFSHNVYNPQEEEE